MGVYNNYLTSNTILVLGTLLTTGASTIRVLIIQKCNHIMYITALSQVFIAIAAKASVRRGCVIPDKDTKYLRKYHLPKLTRVAISGSPTRGTHTDSAAAA
jgi:hypothetical protein